MKLKDLQNTHLHWVLERWIHLVEQQSAHTKVKNAILKSCILTAVSWYWALFSKVHFLSRFGAQLLALQLVSGHGKHTIKQWLMNLCGLGAAVFNNSLSTLTFLQGHQYTAQDWEWKIRWECIIGAWADSFKRKKKGIKFLVLKNFNDQHFLISSFLHVFLYVQCAILSRAKGCRVQEAKPPNTDYCLPSYIRASWF